MAAQLESIINQVITDAKLAGQGWVSASPFAQAIARFPGGVKHFGFKSLRALLESFSPRLMSIRLAHPLLLVNIPVRPVVNSASPIEDVILTFLHDRQWHQVSGLAPLLRAAGARFQRLGAFLSQRFSHLIVLRNRSGGLSARLRPLPPSMIIPAESVAVTPTESVASSSSAAAPSAGTSDLSLVRKWLEDLLTHNSGWQQPGGIAQQVARRGGPAYFGYPTFRKLLESFQPWLEVAVSDKQQLLIRQAAGTAVAHRSVPRAEQSLWMECDSEAGNRVQLLNTDQKKSIRLDFSSLFSTRVPPHGRSNRSRSVQRANPSTSGWRRRTAAW
jgi:hypothetical protein